MSTRRKKRPGPRERGYDYTWEKLRKKFLAEHPLCKYCGELGRIEPAIVVDHIIPVRERPDLLLDESNLQSLCQTCHSSVKQKEEIYGARIGCDVNGVPLDANHHWNK